jgi:dephospho-CoA kinase
VKATVPENKAIGITGGIGSGKSSVSHFMATHFSWPLLDIDFLCKELLEIGQPGWHAVKHHFGSFYFTPDGRLDRRRLRKAVFSDHSLRMELNRLIHPLALRELQERRKKKITPLFLVEVPLLFEAGWQDVFQAILVVYADRKTCLQRLMKRDNISEKEALEALDIQCPLAEKVLAADHVIDNSGCWLNTQLAAIHLGKTLLCTDFLDFASKKSLTEIEENNI